MPSRRRVLGLAAGALATASGCIAAPVSGGEQVETPDTTALPEEGKARGEADPITVERTITDSDDEYVPSNDTVRYPATMSGGEVEDYRHVPFEEWADVETASIGASAVQEHLQGRFDDLRWISAGIGKPESEPLQVSVSHETHLDESGSVISEPPVPVSDLLEATPRSITATVELAGQTATRTHPVVAYWDAHVPLAVREENDSEES